MSDSKPGPLLRLGGDAISLGAQIQALAFAPAKPLVAALGYERSLKTWDPRTAAVVSSRTVRDATAGLLAFADDAHVLLYDGRGIVRTEIAGDADPVPLAIAGLPAAFMSDAVVRMEAGVLLLHQTEDDRTPVLWRVDLRASHATALDSRLTARELAAIGVGKPGPYLRYHGAAIGDDGSTLALATFADGTNVTAAFLRWTPTGERLVPVRMYEDPQYSPLSHSFQRQGLLLHPSGRSVIRSWYRPVLIDLSSGAAIRTFEQPPSLPEGSVWGAALLDRGRTLAGTTQHGLVSWDVDTGAVKASRRFDKRLFTIGFTVSETHGTIAVADEAEVLTYATAGLAPLHTATGHGNAVTAVAICPRGRRFASTDGHVLKIWHLPSGEPIWSRAGTIGASLAFSPDGSQLACTIDGSFQIVDAATGDLVSKAPKDGGGSFVWTEDARIVHVDYEELERGTRLCVFEGPDRKLVYDTPTVRLRCRPALSANGERLIVHDESRAHGWDVATRRRLWTRDIGMLAAEVSPNGKYAAYTEVGVVDVLLLDMDTGRFVHGIGVRPRVEAIAWSTSDEIAAGATDSLTLLSTLPVASGAARATERVVRDAHTVPISALAFSRDGGLLASGARDGSLALWKV